MNETVFTENLDKNQLLITRQFNGPLDLVWRAWSEPALLDQWWAPEPWNSMTKHMNFEAGGHRLYCMKGPEGMHWGKTTYLKIKKADFFEAKDSFCDENGEINKEIPGSHWLVKFKETTSGVEVGALNTFASNEAMKQLIQMGIKDGTIAVHKNFDKLIEKLKK